MRPLLVPTYKGRPVHRKKLSKKGINIKKLGRRIPEKTFITGGKFRFFTR